MIARFVRRALMHLSPFDKRARILRFAISNGAVLIFHEVTPKSDWELRTGCTPQFLQRLVLCLRAAGVDIVSLDEAIQRAGGRDGSAPFVVLTFDDGYRDTLHCALPVLERLEAPFSVFVPTQAITRELYVWWLGLRAAFQRHDRVTMAAMGKTFECDSMPLKIAGLREVLAWVGSDFRSKDAIREVFVKYRISIEELVERYFLDAEELRLLANHPLACLGGHSTSHAALSLLPPDRMRAELSDNRRFLENLTDRPVRHLAYPYGTANSCGRREFEAAEKLGFVSAVTTENRTLRWDKPTLHNLPRLNLATDFWMDMINDLPMRLEECEGSYRGRPVEECGDHEQPLSRLLTRIDNLARRGLGPNHDGSTS